MINTTDSNNSVDNDMIDIKINWNKVIVGVVLYGIVLLTICGNVLVLVAVKIDRKLRTSFNYFIVNLAITDVGVAITAMSFQATHLVFGYWPFGEVICAVWIFFDYGMTFVSVFTLTLISIDRFWSVKWAMNYRHYHTKKRCILCILAIWAFMLLLWIPPWLLDRIKNSRPGDCLWDPYLNPELVYVVAVLGHHVPFIIILYCYVYVAKFFAKKINQSLIVPKRTDLKLVDKSVDDGNNITCDTRGVQNEQSDSAGNSSGEKYKTRESESPKKNINTRRLKREKKIFNSLSCIVLSYIILWLPFHIVFDITIIKPNWVPEIIWHITFWMTYVNSTFNPIIYTISTEEFRLAFIRLLRCKSQSSMPPDVLGNS